MTDRFVTVPDSLELPAAVKVPVARLVGPTGAAATPADLGAATAEQGAALHVACAQALVASVIPPITARRGRYTERTQIYAKVLPCLRRRASGEAV